MDERDEFAEQLAETYRNEAPPEMRELLDRLIGELGERLGGSSDAWRGASEMLIEVGSMLQAGGEDSAHCFAIIGMFASAFFDHPLSRAQRRSPGT